MNWQNCRAMVTGGAGFIGSHLVEELVERDAQVTVVDNLVSGDVGNLKRVASRIECLALDIASSQFRTLITRDSMDVIFHLAANAYVPPSIDDPSFDYYHNLEAPFRMLEALRRARWSGVFINFSSAAVYGEPSRLPIRETDLTIPISPYGVSKLAIERYVEVYARVYGLRAASLRLFSAFGPRQKKQVVYDLIEKLSCNPKSLEVIGDGSQTRDLNFVTNTVQAALVTVERAPLLGEVYNVASGHTYSILELVNTLSEVLGLQPTLEFTGRVRPGDPNRWEADITRLHAFGYEPQVDLREGIIRTVKWWVERQARVKTK